MFKYLYKFLKFAGPQRKHMAGALVFGFFQSIFEAFSLFASAYVINLIVGGTMTSSVIWVSLGIMLGGIFGAAFCSYFSTQLLTYAGYTIAANSRIDIADRLKYAPMGYFNEHNLGQITNTATNVAESLQDTLTRCILLATKGILMATVITIAMFFLNHIIGLITLAGFVLFLIANDMMHRAGKKASDKKTQSVENAVGAVLEYVQGIAVIKSYNLTGKANKKVSDAIASENEVSYRMERAFIPFVSLQGLVVKLAGVAIIAAAVLLYLQNDLSLGNALVSIIASFMVYNELSVGGNLSSLLRVASNCVDKINETKNLPRMDTDGKDITAVSTDISVKNISFAYDRRKIIDDVSVDIKSGSSLAIVGGSGSGKTTLCNLIIRFWDVDKGSISLGNADIREYKLDNLLKNYSMVFQNVYLFNDTIANNIKFGKADATEEEVRDAAKKACCDDFISRFEKGYNTVIGEGGASISGGEKQRISIARAILKDSPVIILDEATANVDPENEWMLQNAIRELTASKTVIMIAHRLKTVRHADKIIVLDEGRIIEEGTHDELIKLNGKYANFIGMREQSIGWKLGRQS